LQQSAVIMAVLVFPLVACSKTDSKSSEPAPAAVPQTPESLIQKSTELRRSGKGKEAVDTAVAAYTLARTGPRVDERLELAKAQAAAGKSAGAINEIKQLEHEKREQKLPVDEVSIAEVYAQIGDPNAVFRWLSRAAEAKSPKLAGVQDNKDLDPVKSDPRWADFLAGLQKK
jgi:thioredoxin-like negative regulator of GroEL